MIPFSDILTKMIWNIPAEESSGVLGDGRPSGQTIITRNPVLSFGSVML
jgi:hypothetical protein